MLILQFFFNNIGIAQTLTGYGNISITSVATDVNKGTWTNTSTQYTFYPKANGSNVSVTDIQTNLAKGDVVISSICSTCTESGIISVTSKISLPTNFSLPILARTFSINTNSDINILASIDFSTSTSSLKSSITPSIYLSSINGNIKINSNCLIKTNRTVAEDDLLSGNVSLFAQNGVVSINSEINTSTVTSKAGQVGGNITIYGKNGININGNLNATSVKSGSLSVTTYNPVSDLTNQGQISGTIKVASFEKLGTGIFQLKGANIWTGNTSITGSLILGADNSIPSISAVIFNGGSLIPNGFNNTLNSIRVTSDSYIDYDPDLLGIITFNSFDYTNSTANKYLIIKDWQGYTQPNALDKYGNLVPTSSVFVNSNGGVQSNSTPGGLNQYGQILSSKVSGGLKGKLYAPNTITGASLTSTLEKIRFITNGITYNSNFISSTNNKIEIIPDLAVNP